MAKVPVVRQADGTVALVMPDGSRSPLAPEFHRDIAIPISAVQNVAGTGPLERLTAKGLTNSPEAARRYLESIGYETRLLPPEAGPWNFALRRSAKEPWKILDPIGGLDVGDLLDLVGDVAIGVPATIGASVGSAGGPVGTFLGAGVGSAVGEFGRQTLGQMAGVPQNIDMDQVALQGGVGALSVPVGAAIGAGVRGIARVARGNERLVNAITSRINGVRNTQSRSAEQVNTARASIAKTRGERIGTFGRIDGAAEHAPRFFKRMDDIVAGQAQQGPFTFASRQLMLQKLDSAARSGLTGNVAPVVDDLMAAIRRKEVSKVIPKPSGGRGMRVTTQSAMSPRGKKVLMDVLNEISEASGSQSFATMPVNAIDNVLERLTRKFASETDRLKLPADAAEAIAKAIDTMEESVIRAFDSAGDSEYRALMGRFNETMRRAVATHNRTLPGAEPAARHASTARYLRDLDADVGAGYRRYLEEIEEDLNIPGAFKDIMEDLTTSKGFGFRGEPPTIGALAATGGPRGMAFGAALGAGAGATMGGLGGGVFGAGIGALSGLALSIPAVGLQARMAAGSLTRGAQAIPRTLQKPLIKTLTPGALTMAAQPFADAAVVHEKPRRKQVQLGQF